MQERAILGASVDICRISGALDLEPPRWGRRMGAREGQSTLRVHWVKL